MTAAFHRCVEIAVREASPGMWEARGVVEDDYHHFRVVLSAKEGLVVDVGWTPLRYPNSLCPAASDRLVELVDKPLTRSAAAVMEYTNARQQCTHQFDLAALMVAALARHQRYRRYDVTVPDRVDGRTTPSISRDGVQCLAWELEGSKILSPEPYAGRTIGTGFTAFIRSRPEDEAEAALVMRRTVYISQGRGFDPKMLEALESIGPRGGCWAWQPERSDRIVRIPESRLDFEGRSDDLVSEDHRWLAFAE